jgi:hypothetical protein
MEHSEEILRLLAEIRDLQREHLAEYKRISEEVLQANRVASEKASVQYRASLKSAQALWLAILILIAVCVGANLFVLVHVAGGR